MKKQILRTLPLFAAICMTLSLSSCVKEKFGGYEPGISNDRANVVLRLKTPGSFSTPTRALSVEQENKIDNVYILAFKGSGDNLTLSYIVAGTTPAQDETTSNISTFTATLPASTTGTDTYRLMIVANAREMIESVFGVDLDGYSGNTSYASIQQALNKEITGKIFASTTDVLPMWGDTGFKEIKANMGTVTVNMVRSIARIDVGVGAPQGSGTSSDKDPFIWDGLDSKGQAIPFELEKVYVIQPNKDYAVVPVLANITGSKATAVSSVTADKFDVDESINEFEYNSTDITDDLYTTRSVYVPEAVIIMGGTSGDANHLNRMAVVVGGSYKGGATTYYRLDFIDSDKNLKDVLRNHLYQFSISSVSGPGFGDPETAYKSLSMNMTANITDWDEGEIGDIEFYGNYYFGIQRREVKFSAFGGLNETVVIKTNIPDFSMSLAGTKRLQAGDTYISDNFGYTLVNTGGDNYTLTINTKSAHVSSSQSSDRQDSWAIKAGNIQNLSLNVIQKWESTYISVVDGQSSRLYPEGATGAAAIPLDIVSSVPVTVGITPSEASFWIRNIAQPTETGGIYSASMNIEVLPFKYGEGFDGTSNRSAVITVTAGTDVRNYTITQEAPYLSVNPLNVIFDRSGNQTKTVQIQTNLLAGHFKFNFNIVDRLSCTPLVNAGISSRPRYQRFDVSVDLETPTAPTSGFGTTFTVMPELTTDYGLEAVTGLVNVRSTANVWGYYWLKGTFLDEVTPWLPGSYSSVDDYFFPWNTTQIEFDVNSNVGVVERNTAQGLNGGYLTLGTLSTTDGTGKYPYSFEFVSADYTALRKYELVFSPQMTGSGEGDLKMTFSRGAQIWSRANWTGSADPATGAVDYNGYTTASGTTVAVTNNIKWGARIDGFDPSDSNSWLKIHTVNTPGWMVPSDASDMTQNDRITVPQTSADDLKKITNLSVQVAANSTLLRDAAQAATDYKRSARIVFENLEGVGLSLADHYLTVTQYAPVLRYDAVATQNGAAPLPANGTVIPPTAVTYTIHADYNVAWGVKVYTGDTGSTLTTPAVPFPGNSTIVSAAPAVNGSVTVTIPTNNPFNGPRNVYIYLYALDTKFTNGRNTEIPVASLVQESDTPLAAPGVIGYIRGTNTLTLAGSKEYKNTSVDNGTLSDQTVYVAYFRWGSLIALGSESGNNDVFDKNDVIAVPSEYGTLDYMKNTIIGSNTANAAWSLVPYNPNTAWPSVPASGYGDPCDYYFGDGWRLPTSAATNPFSWYPDGGSPFGNVATQLGSISWSSNPGNTAIYVNNANAPYTDLPISGAVAGNGAGGQDWSMFLPVTGSRNYPTGAVNNQGALGLYWSSTPYGSSNGHHLTFRDSSVQPGSYSLQSHGLAVRCVRVNP